MKELGKRNGVYQGDLQMSNKIQIKFLQHGRNSANNILGSTAANLSTFVNHSGKTHYVCSYIGKYTRFHKDIQVMTLFGQITWT